MKKYKLIKEYPGSPKIGFVLDESYKIKHGGLDSNPYYLNNLAFNPDNHLEFWEEVIEKDYEILSFICNKDLEGLSKGDFLTKGIDLLFSGKSKTGSHFLNSNEETLLLCNHWSIHSVKRLSDGEVFTIGDITKLTSKIKYFEIDKQSNLLIVRFKDGEDILCFLKKSKIPLFTTEDGINIYENDEYTWVASENHGSIRPYEMYTVSKANKDQRRSDLEFPGRFHNFSTRKLAEEYILLNKPCLCVNDLATIYKTAKNILREDLHENSYELKLLNLIKSKLKIK